MSIARIWDDENKTLRHPTETDIAAAEAKKRLIAAAPDMLEALRSAEAVIEASISYYGSDAALSALRDARAAISKAEGRS
jgi:hypothetical protein